MNERNSQPPHIRSIKDLIELTETQQRDFKRIADEWREAARVLPEKVRVTLSSLRLNDAEIEYRVAGLRRTLEECAARVTEAGAGVSAVQCDAELLRDDAAQLARRLDLHRI